MKIKLKLFDLLQIYLNLEENKKYKMVLNMNCISCFYNITTPNKD